MDIRTATRDDASEIREIASRTFRNSYALSPGQIETLLEELFSDERIVDRIQDERAAVLVVEADESPVGFVDVDIGQMAVIRWLHVDPDAREDGAGTGLFEHVRVEFADGRIDRLAAQVLTESSEGAGFCEQFGFSRNGKTDLEFGGETFPVYVYTAGSPQDGAPSDPTVEVPPSVTIDGTEHNLDRDDEIPGTDGPFFPVYGSEGYEERYGFFCSNCGSTDVGSDTLGRVECTSCGNKHLADEWDAAYF